MNDDQTLHFPVADTPTVDSLLDEYRARLGQGEQPTVEEYAIRYPLLAEQIRQRFSTVADTRPEPPNLDQTIDHTDTAPREAPKSLEQMGDFHVLREIGRGGMGVVYEAEQKSLGRRVALKVLLASTLSDPRQLARFQREARAAARLHHTNIVPVFGVGEHEGIHYYVMQFIPGRGLDGLLIELKWLGRNRNSLAAFASRAARAPLIAQPTDTTLVDVAQMLMSGQQRLRDLTGAEVVLDDDTQPDGAARNITSAALVENTSVDAARGFWFSVARIGYQVADALAYAHDQGILHRDIKPANLLLDPKGTVWVTDFGLAKATEQDNLTQTGDVVGTLRYMAPESFRGQNDARTDIYALGLTLYELIALRPAFDATDRSTLMRQVTNAEIPPLRRICPSVPEDLETIVLKALERDPAHRYRSAADFATDLQHFIHDEPILARRATLVQRLARWYRHNPVVARLVAALIVVFFAGFAGVTWKWRDAVYQKTQLAQANEEIKKQKDVAIAAREKETSAKEEMKRQATKAESLNNFLVNDLLALASPEKARGRKITVEDVLRQAGPKLDAAPPGDAEVEAAMRNTIGITLYRLGLYKEAEHQLRRGLKLSEQELGKDHNDTLGVLNNLAQTLKALVQLAEAEPLYRRSYETRRKQYGDDDERTLGALGNLAQLLQAQGKLIEAEPLYRQSLEGYQRTLGKDSPDALLSQGNLAMLLQAQGKASEAEPLLHESADKLAEAFGDDHPFTLNARHNLAGLWQAAGRRDEAEALYNEVLKARRLVLGDEHPDTLVTMNQLATLLQDQGKLTEAEPLVRSMLEVNLRVLGDEHPQTFVARHNLARLLQAEGRADEAEPLVRANVAGCRTILGPEHPDTLQSMSNLAMVLQGQGKLEEAEPLFRDVLDKQRRVLGPEHMHTLLSLNNLAVALQAGGKLNEAEPLVRQNLEACRRVLGAEHPDTLLAMSSMAQLFMAEGKWSEAESIVQDSYQLHRKVLGDDHPETFNAADDLVSLRLAQSKLPEAEKLVREMLVARRRVLGPTHPDTLKTLNTLALVLTTEDQTAAALPVLQELFELQQKVDGPDAAETLATLRSIGLAQAHLGNRTDAEQTLRKLLSLCEQAKPPLPTARAEAQAALAEVLLLAKRPTEAEPLLRAAVATCRQSLPEGHAQTAQAESLLGACLVALERYDEAEPLLLSSFALLSVKREAQLPVLESLQRVVKLYEAWNKPTQAAEWREKLSAAGAPLAPTVAPTPDSK